MQRLIYNRPPTIRMPRFGLPSLFVVIAICAVLFASYAWVERNFHEPFRRRHAVGDLINSMAARNPPGLSKDRWRIAADWTLNLHGNCTHTIEKTRLATFERELREKLDGAIDMDTIDWIWDEYSTMSECGAKYQRFRRDMREHMGLGPQYNPQSSSIGP